MDTRLNFHMGPRIFRTKVNRINAMHPAIHRCITQCNRQLDTPWLLTRRVLRLGDIRTS